MGVHQAYADLMMREEPPSLWPVVRLTMALRGTWEVHMVGRRLLGISCCIGLLATASGSPAEAAKPNWRGDSMVTWNAGWVGQGVYLGYNESFDNQDGEISIQGSGTYQFRYRIRNTGELRSSFELFAGRWSTPPAKCTFKVTRRGVNITKQIVNTGYTERGLKEGDKTTFKVVVGAAAHDDNCSLQFMSYPTGHYGKHDEVVITVGDTT